jgi:choice-of-anchor C domain-containing protein
MMISTCLAAMVGPVFAAAGSTAFASSVNQGTNLIQNGSFESHICTQYVCQHGPDNKGIVDWTVGKTNVDIQTNSYFAAYDGNQSVDLSGSASGSVRQAVATTSGTQYDLSWYLSGNMYCGPTTKTLNVYWDKTLVGTYTFDTTGDTSSAPGWEQESVTVTATSTKSKVKFADEDDPSACGAEIDDVSLVAEPPASR